LGGFPLFGKMGGGGGSSRTKLTERGETERREEIKGTPTKGGIQGGETIKENNKREKNKLTTGTYPTKPEERRKRQKKKYQQKVSGRRAPDGNLNNNKRKRLVRDTEKEKKKASVEGRYIEKKKTVGVEP